MSDWHANWDRLTRRAVLRGAGSALGAAALSHLLGPRAAASAGHTLAGPARRAIYLFMSGAPSQLDLWDYKPKLKDRFRADLRLEKYEDGSPVLRTRVTTMTSGQQSFPLAPTKYAFTQHGACGAWVSELLPHTAKMVDDLTIVRSLWTEAINHDPAITYMLTGNQLPGRPSLGSWLGYGLGSMNDNLPTFMVMTPYWSGRPDAQAIYNRLWGSGFLPSRHQGVALRSAGDPVLFLSNPDGIDASSRRRTLDALGRLNAQRLGEVGDPEIEARIAQYEMAFRMQTSVPELVDISQEPQHVLDLYGPEVTKPGSFARSCLLARRMIERDVRFVQIFHRGWDQHFNVAEHLPAQCRDIDQPSWALVQDLKQRGLLDDTLVIWGGEFGRTAYCQGDLTPENYGRDHHPGCFTVWMTGGGFRRGLVYGTTDDYGCNIVDASGQPTSRREDGAVHIRDFNATLLNQLGLDHEKLTYRYRGLDEKLTGVQEARVVQAILNG